MPSDMIKETRWLRDRIDIPIVADEAVKTAADIPKLAEAYDGMNGFAIGEIIVLPSSSVTVISLTKL